VTACPHCGFENAAGRKFCGGCGAPLARTCPSCGAANEPGMRFCGECGSAIGEEAPPPAAAAQPRGAERRLVSVLFADLVGFTPLSESRDPEEVRELLSRYFDACRRLIAIYGGTVEKFIGDAVMAVWGTPTAQEDDAERAVRTALDLVTAVAALGEEIGAAELQLRAGVLTGEAAVNLAAEGEGMVAGDLVNTAARIQAAAAPGTVLVGDATRRATAAAIAYEPAGEHELKGKAEPISLFQALRVTAVRGGARTSSELEPPFVGRARELRLVKEHFHGAAEERKAHLVSVVGIAGIGKSRLAWEFEKYLDGVADEVLWHRGRCLAYGDGVAYWALAEMVRMRALIAEEDGPEEALGKLRTMLEERVADAGERTWLEPRLAHLLGLAEHASGDRQDLFSAWRLFFERLAERSPVMLVFEDLQWADSALLDFVEHLLEWSHAQPIFVLALARPELADRRPGFGATGRNATTLSLEPLASAAMEELLDGFVPGLPDDLRTRILVRAEGVPLYAVETVRMLLDRGLLEREGDVYRPTAIRRKAAERLALAGERAASLAAPEEAQTYFGKAAALADEPVWEAELLERAGHAAQDGGRYPAAIDLYERAIELYRSVGEARHVARTTAALGGTMRASGDISAGAERMEEAFAALADEEPGAELAELAEALGRVRWFLGESEVAAERLERALEISEALVLPNTLVHALNTKHLLLSQMGRHEEALGLLEHAIELGRTSASGEPLERALFNLSYQLHARDRFAEAIEVDIELIEWCRRHGQRVEEQRSLGHLAYSRWMLGELESFPEMLDQFTLSDTHAVGAKVSHGVQFALLKGDVAAARAAFEQGTELHDSEEHQMRAGYLAVGAAVLRAEGRPFEALAAAQEAIGRYPMRRHPFYKAAWGEACEAAFDLGDLEQAEELLVGFEQLPPSERTPLLVAQGARFRGRLCSLRGDRENAAEFFAWAVVCFRELQTPYYLAIALLEQAELGVDDPAPLLAEAREIFERLGARPWLERVDALERAVTV
jgi:class 3 adenylate cyclase/tetratricopeptide (TPR) repeat protein